MITYTSVGVHLLGVVGGFMLGLAVCGIDAKAQCCAQYDVPLNVQIEQEHAMRLYEDLNRPVAPNLFYEPCLK